MHQRTKKFLHTVDLINEWCGKILSFLIIVLMGVVLWGVVMRYVFKSPVPLSLTIGQRILFLYIVLGGGYALRIKAHVNMDIFYQRFSLRKKALVDLLTSVFFFLFCGGMLCGALIWSHPLVQHMKFPSDPLTVILYYPASLWLIIGAFLMLLQGLAKFIRDLATIISKGKTV